MASDANFDLAQWQVHETETDCALVFRSTSGQVFYCHIWPENFVQSPTVEEQYYKCLEILRTGEVEIDGFYEEDAYDWLFQCFKPLIDELVKAYGINAIAHPTLADYIFPKQSYNLQLGAVDNELKPLVVKTTDHGWSRPAVKVDDDFVSELDQWTRSYTPSEVHLCYDRPHGSLVKIPKRTFVIGEEEKPIVCFSKRFGLSFGSSHAKKELETMKKITQARFPSQPKAFICQLVGVVRQKNELFGMLFAWIDAKSVLSKATAAKSPVPLRQRWLSQINTSVQRLHENGIIWGDVKAENVLIDKNENAWIIDFGGGYTPGWVDADKAGTLEGDFQGMKKISEMLCH
ncbi:serine threonine protein kinase [Fusarium flagelliforme]|uniref:Serine threonine protein kinase n=1 Tax=Fusarium flagelliforme TaxID=2675880 RepID=A0A395MR84_9HYPO|nr:serine threonine protein kinase [Fusarium flagelliforme]